MSCNALAAALEILMLLFAAVSTADVTAKVLPSKKVLPQVPGSWVNLIVVCVANRWESVSTSGNPHKTNQ
jgi:hypothetical protein